jgi:hypothetical protein
MMTPNHTVKIDDYDDKNCTVTFLCTYPPYKLVWIPDQTSPPDRVLIEITYDLDDEAFELLDVGVSKIFDDDSGDDIFQSLPLPIRELLNKHLMKVFDLKEEVLYFVQCNMDGRYIF